jgi:hypothetical protein
MIRDRHRAVARSTRTHGRSSRRLARGRDRSSGKALIKRRDNVLDMIMTIAQPSMMGRSCVR